MVLFASNPNHDSLKMFLATLWMQIYGGTSPKRTLLVSNSPKIEALRTGKLIRSKYKSKVSTATKYRDSQGVLRYKGTKELKSTQPLDYSMVFPFEGLGKYFTIQKVPPPCLQERLQLYLTTGYQGCHLSSVEFHPGLILLGSLVGWCNW